MSPPFDDVDMRRMMVWSVRYVEEMGANSQKPPAERSQLAAALADGELRTLDYEFATLERHGNDIHLSRRKVGEESFPEG